MVFSSTLFLFVFLPVTLLVYYAARQSNVALLAASLLFYAWGEPTLIVVMVGSIAINYLLAVLVDRTREEGRSRIVLAFAVAVNLVLLVGFKYANFLVDNLNGLLRAAALPQLEFDHVQLPLGISFFTFQALSYVIDVYRREAAVAANPLTVALYISLFPQLVAGPIVRYADVAAQIIRRVVTRESFAAGVRRFVVGLGKKVLVANALATPADAVFAIPAGDLTPGLAWLGVACYTLQIYFDFSGYSDMAIGLGRMFGFEFLENFNYPYVAGSITEFWRRWHISLSTWFRDYLYIPLGGNRRGPGRTYANLVTVFALCGLWHGARWTFVVWGLYHGGFLVVERLGLGAWLARRWQPLRHAYAILVVMLGWAFFRADTLSHALAILMAMGGAATGDGVVQSVGLYLNAEVSLALVAGAVAAAPVLPAIQAIRGRMALQGVFTGVVFACAEVAGLALLLVGAAMSLASGTYNPFIYFRF